MVSSLRLSVNVTRWNPSSKEFAAALACLQPEERQRIIKFKFLQDAKLSLIGRLLIRYSLVKCVGAHARESRLLARDAKGKPVLSPLLPSSSLTLKKTHGKAEKLSFRFNVSHAGDFVVLAASDGCESLGVDVMNYRTPLNKSVSRYFDLMEENFTSKEWHQINDIGSIQQSSDEAEKMKLRHFYRHWTLKESYIKAIGVGLGMELQRLSFIPDDAMNYCAGTRHVCSAVACELDEQLLSSEEWQFEQSHLDEKHEASVAIHFNDKEQYNTYVENNGKREFEEISIDLLLQHLESLIDVDSEEMIKAQEMHLNMKERMERHL
eukprot:m.19910 g.19910  ORF g.19910 m.19910 type:complete len:322 (+) comp5189_c0_seq3:82-1047(+)